MLQITVSAELREKKKQSPNCITKVPKRQRTHGFVAALGHPCICKIHRPPTWNFFLFTNSFEFPMARTPAYKFALLLPSLFPEFQVIKHNPDFLSHCCWECWMDLSPCQKQPMQERPKWWMCHTRANLTQEHELGQDNTGSILTLATANILPQTRFFVLIYGVGFFFFGLGLFFFCNLKGNISLGCPGFSQTNSCVKRSLHLHSP